MELRTQLANLLYLLPGVPFFLLQRLIRPWLVMKIGKIRSDRLGHFIGESDLYLSRGSDYEDIRKPQIVLYFFDSRPINQTFAASLEAKLNVRSRFFLKGAYALNRLSPKGQRYLVKWPQISGMADLSSLCQSTKWFGFGESDMSRGLRILRELGLSASDRYVCLFLRDSTYGMKIGSSQIEREQTFRNCSLESFEPAIEYLSSRGYKVVRMGHLGSEPPGAQVNGLIDYPSTNLASDFGDLFVTSRCAFAIACDTGAVHLPILFRKPLAITNVMTPWGLSQGTAVDLYLMKSWRDPDSRYMSLKDLLFEGSNFRPEGPSASFFTERNLTCEDCTPADILAVAQEMHARVTNISGASNSLTGAEKVVREILSIRKSGNWNVRFPEAYLSRHPTFLGR